MSLASRPSTLQAAHGHQQGKAAVQPAGDAQHAALGVGVLHSLSKSLGLNAQNQLAPLRAGRSCPGARRAWGRPGGSGRVSAGCSSEFHRRYIRPSRGIKVVLRLALLHQTTQVQFGHGIRARERRGVGQQACRSRQSGCARRTSCRWCSRHGLRRRRGSAHSRRALCPQTSSRR